MPSFEKSHLIPGPSEIAQLHDLLRFSGVPTEAVTSTFQNIIDHAPPELARYDIEIQSLEQTLAALKSDRTLLQSYTDGCRSVFSPVRRLPRELLVEIFDLCAPPDADVIRPTVKAPEEMDRVARKYLMQLSQVCARWGNVVMVLQGCGLPL
ncbi:hypothetical protein B0H13DRAFT_1718572 [Mycena leptocephala]|nr:hypothetical protein B0H13DRAFT_1718572 [Mycena leptocephala]